MKRLELMRSDTCLYVIALLGVGAACGGEEVIRDSTDRSVHATTAGRPAVSASPIAANPVAAPPAAATPNAGDAPVADPPAVPAEQAPAPSDPAPSDAAPSDAPASEPAPSDATTPTPPAADSGAATPSAEVIEPSYEVPVGSELAPFARYRLSDVRWMVKDGQRRLVYELPEDLLGHGRRVDFRGPDTAASAWTLDGGAVGTAQCVLAAGQMTCREQLPGVQVDVAAVEARVMAGELAPQQLEVTKVFQGDPIGVLRFTAP